MRNIDAKRIVVLHGHCDILPDQRIRLGNIDDLLKYGLVLTVHSDKDGILHIDTCLAVLDIVDKPFSEVGELRLENEETTLFVISASADSLTHENPILCAI